MTRLPMDQLLLAAQPDSSPSQTLAIVLALAACAAVWTGILSRKFHGLPVLPYEPRRQVPWNGLDVLVVVLLAYLFVPVLVASAGATLRGEKLPASKPAVKSAAETGAETSPEMAQPEGVHPLQLLLARGNPRWMIVLAVLVAVVVAPLSEEFLYRVVLQGWLESIETRWRRIRCVRALTRGLIAVGLASLIFASMHFRSEGKPVPVERTAINTAEFAIASVAAVIAAVCFLRMRGASWADLGVVPRKLLTDVKLGLLASLAIILPVLLLFRFCQSVFPKHVTPDPVPLFFLALAMGVLCYRTRRVAPAIVLHAVFNGVNVLNALLEAPK